MLMLMMLWLSACSDDERRGVLIEMPTERGLIWEFDIYEYYDDEEWKTGTIRVENFEVINFQQREDILRQRRAFRIDSLSTGPDSLRFISAYYDLSDTYETDKYFENFFRVFGGALSGRVLDTLTTAASQTGAQNFTRFQNDQPGWHLFSRFDSRSNRNFQILETRTYDLEFFLRDNHLEGTVDVRITGLYDSIEQIDTPWRDGIPTHKMRTLATFDFDLVKNGETQISPFREVMEMISWYHEEGGLIRRDRKPFEITIPTIPTRGPGIVDPGIRWDLTDVQGFDF